MTKIIRTGISKHMSYNVKELTVKLDVNEKTISRWMEIGLEAVPGGMPFLFRGSNLQDFLRKKNSRRKVPLKRGEFYCFTCKAPRRAKKGSTQALRGKEHALCKVCNGKMSRTIQPVQDDYTIPLFPM